MLCESIAAFWDMKSQIVVEIEEAPPCLSGGKMLHRQVDLALGRTTQAFPDGWRFEAPMSDRFCAVAGPRPVAQELRCELQARGREIRDKALSKAKRCVCARQRSSDANGWLRRSS